MNFLPNGSCWGGGGGGLARAGRGERGRRPLASLAQFVARRRVDRLGLTVMIMLAIGAAVSLITGSPRVLLARDGWLTGAWAAWFFLSLPGEPPGDAFVFSRPLLEGRRVMTRAAPLGPAGRHFRDTLWDTSPRFRRNWQVSTIIWGTATLTDAVIRVVHPPRRSPSTSSRRWPRAGCGQATFVVLQVVTNIYFARAGRGSRCAASGPRGYLLLEGQGVRG